jgi:hypothetical protein
MEGFLLPGHQLKIGSNSHDGLVSQVVQQEQPGPADLLLY